MNPAKTSTQSSGQPLLDILCRIHATDEMEEVLASILTPREFKEVNNRIKIFALLIQQMPQREIAARLGVGIATVTRGAGIFNNKQTAALNKYLLGENPP